MPPEATLAELLAQGVAHCRAVVIGHGHLLLSLFLAGLLGSASHCVGMCGPFVLGQVVARLESRPALDMRERDRAMGALLIPYHLGRMTTYTMLGAAAGGFAGGLIEVSGLRWLSATLLIAAAIAFLGYALARLGVAVPWSPATAEGVLARWVSRLARPLFDRPVGIRGYALGLALGFLPCGLLYGALAAAASSGGTLAGAIAMACFTLGTVPALVAVGFAGHVAGRQWRHATARVVPVLLLVNAGLLTYMAVRMVV